MLTLAPQGSWPVPIIKTEAPRGEGIKELAEKLAEHRAHVEAEGTLSERRRRNLRNEVLGLATVRLRRELEAAVEQDPAVQELLDEVVARRLDPASAAGEILRRREGARRTAGGHGVGIAMPELNGMSSGGWRSRSGSPPRSGSSASCARRARGCARTRSSALGSALFTMAGAYGFSDVIDPQHVVLDPSRVAAQVASGIGFIGGGLIFVRQDAVRGLTTAAGVWVAAAIGLAAGAGLPVLATATTVAYFLVAFGLPLLAERLPRSRFPPRCSR